MNAPKPTQSIKEFILTEKTREEAKKTVQDHFTLTEVYAPTPHSLYNKVLESLKNLADKDLKLKKGVKVCCTKLHTYYSNNAIKLAFFEEYGNRDRDIRKQKSYQALQDEIGIIGSIVVGQMAKESASNMLLSPPRNNTPTKRTQQQVEDDEEDELENPFTQKKSKSFFVVNKFEKPYNIQKPSGNLKSLNKPALQEDVNKSKQYADIYTSNIKYATDALHELYVKTMREQYSNYALKLNPEHYTHALAITKTKNADELENLISDIEPADTFTKFLKYAASDYYINCLRIRPYSINDERAVITTVFKIFSNITGQIVHVWCEKSQPDSRMFYQLDGIGTLPDIPRTYLIFESSGYGKTENINHDIEINIKNMKYATDSLKHCASRYKTASFATFTNVHLFAVHIIQNKMTLTRYSYNENKKFDIIEVRSCEFPLTFADNKKFLKMMELFAFLYYNLQEQKDVFDKLDDERNGVIDIEATEMVKYMLH